MVSLQEGETIGYELAANLRKETEFVGGRLIITNVRFLFEPHTVNMQSGDVEFTINEISEIDSSKVLGVVPNGIKVELEDGSSHTFLVEPSYIVKREEVVDFVREHMAA